MTTTSTGIHILPLRDTDDLDEFGETFAKNPTNKEWVKILKDCVLDANNALQEAVERGEVTVKRKFAICIVDDDERIEEERIRKEIKSKEFKAKANLLGRTYAAKYSKYSKLELEDGEVSDCESDKPSNDLSNGPCYTPDCTPPSSPIHAPIHAPISPPYSAMSPTYCPNSPCW